MKKVILLLLLSLAIFACNSSSREGKIENGLYTSEALDWEIAIPEGYSVREIKPKTGKAGTVNLVSFGLDEQNYFASSLESLENSKKLTPQQYQQFLAEVVKQSYSLVKGIEVKQDLSKEPIGDYYFYTIETEVLDAGTKELILGQRLYNTYLEDQEMFSVLINYTSEEVDQDLTRHFKKSLQTKI
jgi:hypothetical protein